MVQGFVRWIDLVLHPYGEEEIAEVVVERKSAGWKEICFNRITYAVCVTIDGTYCEAEVGYRQWLQLREGGKVRVVFQRYRKDQKMIGPSWVIAKKTGRKWVTV